MGDKIQRDPTDIISFHVASGALLQKARLPAKWITSELALAFRNANRYLAEFIRDPSEAAPHSDRHIHRLIAALAGGVQPPICCIRDSRFPTPQWSVIFPFCTRITSTDSK